jgi:formiminotetrahydrofolate cyclodeaminase
MAKTPRFPTEISVRDFITAVGSAEEAHGTVSAAGVAGGVGASLLLRVAALPHTGSESPHDSTIAIDASIALAAIQQQLIETIETETAVKIFAARNMPQRSEAQRTDRHVALQLALRAAADVPLEVMRLCARGLLLAEALAARCPRRAAADVHLGAALLHAAFSGARANLEGKLTSLTDAAYLASVVDEIARLSDEAATAARNAESSVQIPPA